MTFDHTEYDDLIADLRRDYENNMSTSIFIEAAEAIESLLKTIKQLKNGGETAAFPENVALCPNTGQVYPASEFHADRGMTLRQYYAGQAILAMPHILPLMNINEIKDEETFAKYCFLIAEAMIAQK